MSEREKEREEEKEKVRERIKYTCIYTYIYRERMRNDLDFKYHLFGLESGGPKALCFIRVLITLRVTVPQRTFPSRSST